MPSLVRNNGQAYFITTVVLPTELHDQARALHINLSETLREALAGKIGTEEALE